jgi:hypothetical protein
MIEALIAGERDPQRLAELARGRMKAKRSELITALDGPFEVLAAQLGKGQALDRRWTIIGLFISAVLRGSVTGCDPQAPSTLWILIIREHWRNSVLHSASRLELVLLVTLRWYLIPSACRRT